MAPHKHYHITINLCEKDAHVLTTELHDMMDKDIGFTVTIHRDDGLTNDNFGDTIKNILGEVFKAAFRVQSEPLH